tara:strand:- start:285 stop:821 length:537 start_codon:yes stop_codon:yes gene_type:complete
MKKQDYQSILVSIKIELQLLNSIGDIVKLVQKEQDLFFELFPLLGKIYGHNKNELAILENSYNAIMDEFRKIIYINDHLKLDEKQFNVLVQKQAIEKTSVGINKMIQYYQEESNKQIAIVKVVNQMILKFKKDIIEYKEHISPNMNVDESANLANIQHLEQAISHLDKLTDDLKNYEI